MVDHILIHVRGNPKAQGRPRAFVHGKHAGVYNPSNADDWKSLVTLAARDKRPMNAIEGPVIVDLTFFFARPKRLCRKKDPPGAIPHTSKPDRDNLDKAVLDVLTDLGFWRDDCQVWGGRIQKFYCAIGDSPGAEIRVTWENETVMTGGRAE